MTQFVTTSTVPAVAKRSGDHEDQDRQADRDEAQDDADERHPLRRAGLVLPGDESDDDRREGRQERKHRDPREHDSRDAEDERRQAERLLRAGRGCGGPEITPTVCIHDGAPGSDFFALLLTMIAGDTRGRCR